MISIFSPLKFRKVKLAPAMFACANSRKAFQVPMYVNWTAFDFRRGPVPEGRSHQKRLPGDALDPLSVPPTSFTLA
jgi:hypothetical protein